MFYNYTFPSQPDPIPTSLMPNYVTSAPNINYPSHESDNIGIQLLAKANSSFAIRFSGAHPHSRSQTKIQMPESALQS